MVRKLQIRRGGADFSIFYSFSRQFVSIRAMKKKEIKINYEVFESVSELDPEVQGLIVKATGLSQNSYSPYSNFRVSALLVLESGEIVAGTNVENASYPISICAERNAISNAVTNHNGKMIRKLVIFVDKNLPKPASPCGMCRQSLVETETNQKSPIEVFLSSRGKEIYKFSSCADLLPLAFTGEQL
jgi:cytidine deaminase